MYVYKKPPPKLKRATKPKSDGTSTSTFYVDADGQPIETWLPPVRHGPSSEEHKTAAIEHVQSSDEPKEAIEDGENPENRKKTIEDGESTGKKNSRHVSFRSFSLRRQKQAEEASVGRQMNEEEASVELIDEKGQGQTIKLPKRRAEPEKEETEKTADELNFEQFREEIRHEFLLPHYCKHVAWWLSIAWIVTCCAVLYAYGGSFGGGLSRVWLGVVWIALGFMLLVVQPLKVLLLAVITSYDYVLNIEVCCKRFTPDLFSNPFDEARAAQVKELRRQRASCYAIAHPYAMRARQIELRNDMDMRRLVMDSLRYLAFAVAIYAMVFLNHSDMAYYSTKVMRKLVVSANYTKTIPLDRVRSYNLFLEYLNETLLPALLTNETDGELELQGLKAEPPDPPPGAESGYLYTTMMDRGWTRDSQIKLLGVPRLRQKRVTSTSCYIHAAAPKTRRTCWDELYFYNADRGLYGIGWEPLLPGEENMTDPDLLPWRYRTPNQNKAMPWYGRLNHFLSYEGGGFVLPLGKTMANARLTLDYMDFFNWIDPRTRAIFIDFTTYSPGANLYSVVTIMIEVSASGVFIPSSKIHSDRLLFPELGRFQAFAVAFVVFTLMVVIFACKEALRLWTIGFKLYINEVWSVVNVVLIAVAVGSIVSTTATIFYIAHLLAELDVAANNHFVSFQIAAYWDQLHAYFNGMIFALITVKTFRLLTFLLVYYEWERVLRDAWDPLIGLFSLVLVVVFAFALFFNNVLGNYEEEFSTLWGAAPNMLAHSTRRHDHYDPNFLYHGPLFLSALFFAVFLLYTSYLMVSIFNTILCSHLKAIQSEPKRTHFHMAAYLKSLVVKNYVLPPPILPPKEKPVKLFRRRYDVVPPPYIDEVRLMGLKRETLQLLTGEDYMEQIGLNIAFIVLSENSRRPGTDQYHIISWEPGKTLVAEARVREMKSLADDVVEERNEEIKRKDQAFMK